MIYRAVRIPTSPRRIAQAWRKALEKQTTVESIAAKLEPRLRRRFLAAVAAMKGEVNLEALAEAIRLRGAPEAIAALHPERWPPLLTPTAQMLPIAFAQAARAAAEMVTQQIRVPVSFNAVNPASVMWARTQSARLIVEVNDSVKDAVRSIIGRAFTEGIPPQDAARLIREVIGLTERQSMAVINYRFDLLEAGRAPDDVARLADRYAKQLLNQRALTIARNEINNAHLSGQMELWRQAVDKGYLDPNKTWRKFMVADDERLCERCRPMDGQMVPLFAPFHEVLPDGKEGASVGMPPSVHVQCRCAIGISFVSPEEEAAVAAGKVYKYSPDQPREPAGTPEGGQWTGGETDGHPGERDTPLQPEDSYPTMDGPLWTGPVAESGLTSDFDRQAYQAFQDQYGLGPCGFVSVVLREQGLGEIVYINAQAPGQHFAFPHYAILNSAGAIIDRTNPGLKLKYYGVQLLRHSEMPDLVDDAPEILHAVRQQLRKRP